MTYAPFQANLFGATSTSSQEAPPANLIPKQDSTKVREMKGISIQNFLELSTKVNQSGLSLRMFTDCLISNLDAYSRTIVHHWKIKVTQFNRFVFQHHPLMVDIDGTVCGLLPTPTASDAKGESKGCSRHQKQDMIRRVCLKYHYNQVGSETVYPHPEYLEAVMGFPMGWTELEVLETP